MSKDDTKRNIQVGLFVSVTIVVLVVLVLLLGRTQSLFSRKAILNAEFADISGLVVGAPVRLAGLDIGIVRSIRFDNDLHEKKVHVTLGVEGRYLDRIRQDSVATLGSKGLLGDMIVSVSVGSADQPALKDGDAIKSEGSASITEIVGSLKDGINQIRTLTNKVDERLTAVLTDRVAHDVGRIAHSTADMMEKVERGQGLLHALVYDPRLGRNASQLVDDARNIVAHVNAAVGHVDRILGAVENGNGAVHALLYGSDGKKLVGDAGHAIAELNGVIGEIQHGNGLVHSLIYEQDKANLIENLAAMSRTLRAMTDEMNQGKGTLGALVKDPSVYEDLKVIVSNVRRNRLLKALVRFTIKKDSLQATPRPR